MELNLKDRFFIVTGASSGFGEAILRQLLVEGARVLAVARRASLLSDLATELGSQCEILVADVMLENFPDQLIKKLNGRIPDGILLNAGGPPAGGFREISQEMWIRSFHDIFLWKAAVLNTMMPLFIQRKYGRILIIESVSVKQPVEGLILSNSLRPAVVGMARSLAGEVAAEGITINIFAPGYHETDAMQRLFKRRSDVSGISQEEARQLFVSETGMNKMGNPADLAKLGVWLLSENSAFITGQVISVAGDQIKGIFG